MILWREIYILREETKVRRVIGILLFYHLLPLYSLCSENTLSSLIVLHILPLFFPLCTTPSPQGVTWLIPSWSLVLSPLFLSLTMFPFRTHFLIVLSLDHYSRCYIFICLSVQCLIPPLKYKLLGTRTFVHSLQYPRAWLLQILN